MEPNQSWSDISDSSDIHAEATVEMERHNDLAVARIRGEIDTSNADRIERALQAGAEARETVSGMIVELNGVEYLNSAAIKMLSVLPSNYKPEASSCGWLWMMRRRCERS